MPFKHPLQTDRNPGVLRKVLAYRKGRLNAKLGQADRDRGQVVIHSATTVLASMLL